MDPDHSYQIIGIVLSLMLLAFSSAVEATITSISRHRLRMLQEEDSSRAHVAQRLLSEPYQFKATVVILNIAALVFATAFTLTLVEDEPVLVQVVALAVLFLAVLIFCEALPRALALHNLGAASRFLSGPMWLIVRLLWPFAAILGFAMRPIIGSISGREAARHPFVTEEELRLLVNVSEEEGLIEPDERDMIEGIFSFGDTRVREVMVPRVDIVALDEQDSLDDALEAVIKRGHSRIPVYHDTIDQVTGILYAKDLLPYLRADRRDVALSGLLRAPFFVPETMKVDVLLKDLQARRVHLAVVVDEYGGTAGVITIEDLLEEIVGDIQDEYDSEEPEIQPVGTYEYNVDARTLLDDINDTVGMHLSSDEANSIGGLVFEQLGRLPLVGDRIQIDDHVLIEVLSVERLRPRRLRLRYVPSDGIEKKLPSVESIEDDQPGKEDRGHDKRKATEGTVEMML